MTRPCRGRRVAGVLFVLVAAVSGCADGAETSDRPAADEKGTPTTRPVTPEEAARLADVLVANYETGGAHLTATVPYGTATFTIEGDIDWANHVGRVTVRPTVDGEAAPAFDIAFDPDVTFEAALGLEAAMELRGRPGVRWVARPLDPASTPLHLVLRLVETAASTVRDNPVLLQSNGVTALGQADLDGIATERFDQGRTQIWVGKDDGLAHRIDAELAAVDTTATIRFDDFGPRTIDVPDHGEIVGIDEIGDLYRELVGG